MQQLVTDTAGLKALMDYLNTNAGAITALLTVVLVATTIFYAVVTYGLFRETRLARLATQKPEVVAYMRPHRKLISALNVHFGNIGLGPAFAVKVSFKLKENEAEKYGLSHLPIEPRHLTNVMPAQSGMETNFGTYYELVEKHGSISPFSIRIDYEDIRGKRYVFEETFEARSFEWLSVLGQSSSEEIATGVTDAARALKDIARNTNSR